MSAMFIYQPGLFDESLTPAEIAHGKQVAAFLPEKSTLRVSRSPVDGSLGYVAEMKIAAMSPGTTLGGDPIVSVPAGVVGLQLAEGLRQGVAELQQLLEEEPR